MKIFSWIATLAIAFQGWTSPAAGHGSVNEETKPNIVLIFIDDMGYGDLTCYGANEYQTPNIDRLAARGMRFTNFLVPQAVCSASRAGLLTGCYPNRVGIKGALMPYHEHGLNSEEETLSEILKETDYRTICIGKWHLGHHREFLPLQHGFDEYFGLPYSNDMWPINNDGTPATPSTHARKASYPFIPLIKGNQAVGEISSMKDQALLTSSYTKRAVEFIRKNKERPFFLYLAQFCLYNMRRDPGEHYDVKALHPQKVAELKHLANEARADLGDSLTGSEGSGRREPGRLK